MWKNYVKKRGSDHPWKTLVNIYFYAPISWFSWGYSCRKPLKWNVKKKPDLKLTEVTEKSTKMPKVLILVIILV